MGKKKLAGQKVVVFLKVTANFWQISNKTVLNFRQGWL